MSKHIERLSMPYPTRNGIAVPVQELELPPSRLDLSDRRNENLHHNEWTAQQFGKSIIYLMVRNMACNQLYMPVDQHNTLHREYDPPRMPKEMQCMVFLEECLERKEQLRMRQAGHYALREFTQKDFNDCVNSYDSHIHYGREYVKINELSY